MEEVPVKLHGSLSASTGATRLLGSHGDNGHPLKVL
jgi:hypothetical protein